MKPLKSLFFFLFMIHACSFQDKDEVDAFRVPQFHNILMEGALDKEHQPAALSSIGRNISYIIPEQSHSSTLRDILSITMYDSSIFLGDMYQMLEFHVSGKFIRAIGKQGKGPGEYIYAYELVANDTMRGIRGNNAQVFLYTPQGRFIRSLRLDMEDTPAQMLLSDEDKVVFRFSSSPVSRSLNPFSLCITDLNFNVLRTIGNPYKRKEDSQISTNGVMYLYQGKVRFREWGADTLYTVTSDSLTPYAMISLGQNELPTEIPTNIREPSEMESIFAPYTGKVMLKKVVEDNSFIYLTMDYFTRRDSFVYGMYSKIRGEARMLGRSKFQNDLDGGLPFFPRYVYQDSILVDWVDAYDLREQVLHADASEMRRLYGKKFDHLLALAKSLNDDSGKVLVLVQP